jgi:hypothetical protein
VSLVDRLAAIIDAGKTYPWKRGAEGGDSPIRVVTGHRKGDRKTH